MAQGEVAREAIRVVVVDGRTMVREGIEAVLGRDDRLVITGTAGSLREFRAEAASWSPNVVVAAHQLPDGTGAELVADARAIDDDCGVLIVSALSDEVVLEQAIAGGCAGFVSMSENSAVLGDAIATVRRGATVFPADAVRRFALRVNDPLNPGLTGRESEVLRLLADARNVNEIAGMLSVSVSTARNHVQAVLSKLDARSQLEAVVLGVRQGLVEITRESQYG